MASNYLDVQQIDGQSESDSSTTPFATPPQSPVPNSSTSPPSFTDNPILPSPLNITAQEHSLTNFSAENDTAKPCTWETKQGLQKPKPLPRKRVTSAPKQPPSLDSPPSVHDAAYVEDNGAKFNDDGVMQSNPSFPAHTDGITSSPRDAPPVQLQNAQATVSKVKPVVSGNNGYRPHSTAGTQPVTVKNATPNSGPGFLSSDNTADERLFPVIESDSNASGQSLPPAAIVKRDRLTVAIESDINSSGLSMPSSPTPGLVPVNASDESSSGHVLPPSSKHDHLSVIIESDTNCSGQSIQTQPISDHLPSADGNGKKSNGQNTEQPSAISEVLGEMHPITSENKKSKRRRFHKKLGKKHKLEEGNESTEATSSSECASKHPKPFKGHKIRFPWQNRRPFWKQDKGQSSSDYRESSSSEHWSKVPDQQSSSSGLDIDIYPDQFVNAVTLHSSSPNDGVQVVAHLLLPQGSVSYDDMTAKDILQKLSTLPEKDPVRKALRRTLLTKTLPAAERQGDLSSVAFCIQSSDSLLNRCACQSLERMIMNPGLCQHLSYKDVVRTLKIIWSVVEDNQHGHEEDIRRHCQLLLLCSCAVLCACDPAASSSLLRDLDTELCQTMKTFIKDYHQHRGSRSYRMLKGATAFFQDLSAALMSRTTYHETDWEVVLTSPVDEGKERQQKLMNANFAQLLVVTYSLLKEIIRKAWDSVLDLLIEEVHRILRVVAKQRLDEDKTATFNFFLVHCLYFIINDRFREDRVEVGERPFESDRKVASLLSSVIRNAHSKQQALLMENIQRLSFHPSQQVRKEMKELLKLFQVQLCQLSLAYAEYRLQIADLKPKAVGSEADSYQERKLRECTWHERGWHGPDDTSLQGAMCVPSSKCLAAESARDCSDHASPRQLTRQHMNHLDKLILLGPHPNLVRLMAFQRYPRPCFYITESIKEHRLLYLLLDRRKHSRWLTEKVLLQAALNIIKALAFLASRGIALRDITTFNMIHDLQEDKHRNVKSFVVKLADLGLADHYTVGEPNDYANKDIRTQRDPGPIPVRWTSWEALFQGRFSDTSMVYAFGYVLFELFTHGCWPFTELSRRSTDDIIQLLFRQSQSLRVFRWPCFPEDVYSLIRSCTEFKPSNRPDIKQLENKIDAMLEKYSTQREMTSMKDSSENANYPPLSLAQEQSRHVPEKGIPMIVQQLLKGDPYRYKNLLQSSWQTSVTVQATEAELLPHDDPMIISQTKQHDATFVVERLTEEFVRSVLPDVESERHALPGVANWIGEPVYVRDQRLHERQYERCWTLSQAAPRMGQFGQYETGPMVQVFMSLTHVISVLHQNQWLHCDLRAANVLLACDDCKVILARIGRMVKLPAGSTSLVCPTIHKDSARWSAPEVLHLGIQSKESDVFMLGTLFWEVFNIADKCRRDPTAEGNSSHLVPFADVKYSDIATMVQEGVLLPTIPDCPPWLYKLICDCRNPDCDARPPIAEVLNRLELNCGSLNVASRKTWVLHMQNSMGCAYPSSFRLWHGNYSEELFGISEKEAPTPPHRTKVFQSVAKTFKRTLSFRTTRQNKSKVKQSSPKPEKMETDKPPKKRRLPKVFKKFLRKSEDTMFYEIGYLDPETDLSNRRSDLPQRLTDSLDRPESDIYDDIQTDDMYSDDTLKYIRKSFTESGSTEQEGAAQKVRVSTVQAQMALPPRSKPIPVLPPLPPSSGVHEPAAEDAAVMSDEIYDESDCAPVLPKRSLPQAVLAEHPHPALSCQSTPQDEMYIQQTEPNTSQCLHGKALTVNQAEMKVTHLVKSEQHMLKEKALPDPYSETDEEYMKSLLDRPTRFKGKAAPEPDSETDEEGVKLLLGHRNNEVPFQNTPSGHLGLTQSLITTEKGQKRTVLETVTQQSHSAAQTKDSAHLRTDVKPATRSLPRPPMPLPNPLIPPITKRKTVKNPFVDTAYSVADYGSDLVEAECIEHCDQLYEAYEFHSVTETKYLRDSSKIQSSADSVTGTDAENKTGLADCMNQTLAVNETYMVPDEIYEEAPQTEVEDAIYDDCSEGGPVNQSYSAYGTTSQLTVDEAKSAEPETNPVQTVASSPMMTNFTHDLVSDTVVESAGVKSAVEASNKDLSSPVGNQSENVCDRLSDSQQDKRRTSKSDEEHTQLCNQDKDTLEAASPLPDSRHRPAPETSKDSQSENSYYLTPI